MQALRLFRVFLPLVIVAACVDVRADTVSRSFDASGVDQLVVQTDVGAIHVRAGGAGDIVVDVERSGRDAGDLAIDFRHDGNTLLVTGEFDEDRRSRRLKVRFDITLPPTVDLSLSTAGGRIDIDSTDGNVDARTSGGRLVLGRIGGRLDARTSGGSIDLEQAGSDARLHTSGGSIKVGRAAGNLDVHTSGGSLKLGRVGGHVRAHTSGGSIRIDEAGGAVDASTSGGNVTATIVNQPIEDSSLSTSGGAVTLYLAEHIAADIVARGFADRAPQSELELDGVRVSDSTLRGKRNGGGPGITLSGNAVHIRKP